MTNIEHIQKSLPDYNCEGMLITDPINRLFATGFMSSAGALLVTEKNAWLIMDSRYYEMAEAAVTNADVLLLGKEQKITDCLKALITENKITTIGFEDGTTSYATHKEWLEVFGVKLKPAQKLVSSLREIKTRDEINKIIKAQRLAEKVFEEILPMISTEMTEKELAAEIIYRSLRNRADEKAFNPIVVSGPNSSRPHGVPGNEKLNKGFLTIDFGVMLDGWCSDTTRTLCIGKPDDEMIKVYDTVLKAQEAGIQAVHGGVKGFDVDLAARKVIEDAGYGDYFGHGFGHSQGLEVHESLKASPLSEDILPAGAVISAEPGIYLPGRFGVRIEDTLYITEEGSENITKLPKQLVVL